MPTGRLIVCATPIGNLGDISDRLRDALTGAGRIYAEDTRRAGKLLHHLAISVPVRSLFVGNEESRIAEVVDAATAGETVVLISDAGMPSVSDPGAAVVTAFHHAGIPVTVIPGPSAVTSAVALSGFGADRFVFEGFLPRKGSARDRRVRAVADDDRVVVLFASPNRLKADLTDLAEACDPDRPVMVAREMTKLHEEIWIGPLSEAAARWDGPVKGEVTVVLGPWSRAEPTLDDAVDLARASVAEGTSVSESARAAAEETGVSRRAIYEELLGDQESS